MLEVVIALTIFAGAAVVVGRIVDLGRRAADRATTLSEASLRAETVMAELVGGSLPLQASASAFTDDPAWQWDFAPQDTSETDLVQLVVTVHRTGREDSPFTLVRWVRRPEIFEQM